MKFKENAKENAIVFFFMQKFQVNIGCLNICTHWAAFYSKILHTLHGERVLSINNICKVTLKVQSKPHKP